MKKMFLTFSLFLLLLRLDISSSNGVDSLKMLCNHWLDTSTLKDFGEGSIRSFQEKSNEEKVIAVWRSIQHLTVTTSVIKRPNL